MPDPSETPAPESPAPAAAAPLEIPGPGPFDPLFVNAEEAARLKAERDSRPAVEVPLKPEEKPEEKDEPEEGEILAEAVKKIGQALEKLGRRGLNMRGVIALLHDANPSISKKAIKAVLEGLRELPAIYGQDPKRP